MHYIKFTFLKNLFFFVRVQNVKCGHDLSTLFRFYVRKYFLKNQINFRM